MGTTTARGLELIRLVHAHPGLTRADAATRLGTGSGTVTGLVQSLTAAGLVDERPAGPSGSRGRPTRQLVAHPDGPLVLAADVTHGTWRIAAVELGGAEVATGHGTHDDSSAGAVLATVRAAATGLTERFGARVRGMGLALPGVVAADRLIDAPLLDWRDVDLAPAFPALPGSGVVVTGNDATFAALAEARRGAARGAGSHLHLYVSAGLGGAVTLDGAVLPGSTGLSGEFGHMPMGDPAVLCPCGARGCWGTAVGAVALAEALGDDLPADVSSYALGVLDRARGGDATARRATAALATALGRGIAGLVNGLDVELVTLGGVAPAIAEVVPDDLGTAYTGGLMRFRRAAAPPIVAGALGDEAPQTGAAEEVWSRLWESL